MATRCVVTEDPVRCVNTPAKTSEELPAAIRRSFVTSAGETKNGPNRSSPSS